MISKSISFSVAIAFFLFSVNYLSADESSADSIYASIVEDENKFELTYFIGESDWESGISGIEFGYGFDNSTVSVNYSEFPNYIPPINTYKKSKELSYTKTYGIYPFIIKIHYTDKWTLSEKKVDIFSYDYFSMNYKYKFFSLGSLNLKVSLGLGYGWGFSREAIDQKTTVLSQEQTSKGFLEVKEYSCSIKETSYNGLVIPVSLDIGIDIFEWLSGSLSYGYLFSSTFSTSTTKYTVSLILFRH